MNFNIINKFLELQNEFLHKQLVKEVTTKKVLSPATLVTNSNFPMKEIETFTA